MSATPDDGAAGLTDFRHALRERLGDPQAMEQGLRERKKKLMRQLISDTATLMFLQRGFDEVRVSEIAAACEVSEKTVYNYFPTKESLVLDREEDSATALRRALGPDATHASPVDAVIAILSDEMDQFVHFLNSSDHAHFVEIVRFNDLIEGTPALKAARSEMMDRLAQVAARAMAARVGIDPEDPEPQVAADALIALWRVYYRAILRYSSEVRTPHEIRDAVLQDVRRAGRLIDSGLWAFTTSVPGMNGRQQVQAATDASNEARRQVVVAMKEARKAWRLLKSDMESRTREDSAATRREANELRREIQRARQELRQEIKASTRQAKGRGRAR